MEPNGYPNSYSNNVASHSFDSYDYGSNQMEDYAASSNANPSSNAFQHDQDGRLLKPASQLVNYDDYADDISVFTSSWQTPRVSARKDWEWSSKYCWPNVKDIILLKRLDIYEFPNPISQQATADIEESRSIRNTPDWFAIRSVFFLNLPTNGTVELLIESAGPPRRHRFRIAGKNNRRDFSKWIFKEKLIAYLGADRVPGAETYNVDYCDLPDRYFLNTDDEALLGRRRIFTFGAYSATQYFILEKEVFHECLDSEGGKGMTYIIEPGPIIFCRKNWKVIGSFYGFDHELPGSNAYTVYTRSDPFPRMLIAMENIDRAEEWHANMKFYAFDIPIPGTSLFTVHHCLRSIHTAAASLQRHRITTEDPRQPWEFRFNIYIFAAELADCSFTYDETGASSKFSVAGSRGAEYGNLATIATSQQKAITSYAGEGEEGQEYYGYNAEAADGHDKQYY